MSNSLNQYPPQARCVCGHMAMDHSVQGCAYQHNYGFNEAGQWHHTSCNRFELAEAQT